MFPVQLQTAILTRLMSLPDPAVRLLAGGERVVDGQALGVRTRLLLRLMAIDPTPRHVRTLARQRAELGAVCAVASGPLRAVEIADEALPSGVRVRVYRRRLLTTRDDADPPGAGVLYMHGGGFTLGSIDSHDAFARRLADDVGCVVVSLDYRLAPEHPFPAAVDDTVAALSWLRDHAERLGVDPNRIAVAGDSAGGNLAAVAARKARDEGRPVFASFLIYPVVDTAEGHASRSLFGKGLFLTSDQIAWYHDQYAAGRAPDDHPDLHPLRATDHAGNPRTVVFTAGLDPLRDEGRAYVSALQDAGVPCDLHEYPGMFHGFTLLTGMLPEAEVAVADLLGRIRIVLGP